MNTDSCFLGKSVHDQTRIGVHDETRITVHGRARMSVHDGQEYPPTKNVEKVTDVYSKLSEYLEGLKSTKNKVEFKEHEAAITRMVYTLGQAALSDVLSHYDTNCDVIEVEERDLSARLCDRVNPIL